jgi:hypothetical protein
MTTNESGMAHFNGEIWLKSQCWPQEKQLAVDIYACLQQHRYQNINAVSITRSIWQRGVQKIVVSLVDDLWDCALDRSQDTPYLFDCNTMVITDNFLNCPSIYQIYQMPQSFYGIYSYIPDNQDWEPRRDYTFAINRQDYKRMQVLLQLHQNMSFDSGYVSFNCQIGSKREAPSDICRQAFIDEAIAHSPNIQERDALLTLANQMPFKNHSLEHDLSYSKSWLSIIVETYSSDNVISFSEKTFRCLVTPVPWVAYSGRYTMAKLRELGFDIMDDLVDHSYDRLLETQHKIPNFVLSAKNTISKLKTQDWAQTKSRCQAAAFHNQTLLAKLSRIWQENRSAWLQKLSQDIR